MPALSDVAGNRASYRKVIRGPSKSGYCYQSWFCLLPPRQWFLIRGESKKGGSKKENSPPLSSSSTINESLKRRNNFAELRVLVKAFNFKNFWQLVKWRNEMFSTIFLLLCLEEGRAGSSGRAVQNSPSWGEAQAEQYGVANENKAEPSLCSPPQGCNWLQEARWTHSPILASQERERENLVYYFSDRQGNFYLNITGQAPFLKLQIRLGNGILLHIGAQEGSRTVLDRVRKWRSFIWCILHPELRLSSW